MGLVKQKLSVNQHPFDAMANSVAQAVINIQEEIKRDIEKEKEIKEDRKSVFIGQTLEKQLERGRSTTRQSKKKSRSKSSVAAKKQVEESDEDQPNPSYTIFKEGGKGYTKYTVYAKTKDEEEKRDLTVPMRRQLSLPRGRRKPSMEQFISSYKENQTRKNGVFREMIGDRKVTGRRPVERPEDLINKELLEMHLREKEHKKMMEDTRRGVR